MKDSTTAAALAPLDEEIAERSRRTDDEHGPWPCGDGCDDCCRSLARPPQLTRLEHDRLRQAIHALPPSVRADVAERTAAMKTEGPIVCPLLHREAGRCRVYEARPVACRTYGFYARRDHELVCSKVEAYAEGRPVVWGNHEVIDVRLERLAGPLRSLGEWAALKRREEDGAEVDAEPA